MIVAKKDAKNLLPIAYKRSNAALTILSKVGTLHEQVCCALF